MAFVDAVPEDVEAAASAVLVAAVLVDVEAVASADGLALPPLLVAEASAVEV